MNASPLGGEVSFQGHTFDPGWDKLGLLFVLLLFTTSPFQQLGSISWEPYQGLSTRRDSEMCKLR